MMAERVHAGVISTRLLTTLGDGSCRTIEQLETELQLTRKQVSDGAAKLVVRKYLLRMRRGCYQLSASGLAAAASGEVIKSGPYRPLTGLRKPTKDTFLERVWRAMRMRRQFTIGDIAADAIRDEADPEGHARYYVKRLISAGYVVEMRQRQTGTRLTSPGYKQYRLVKDTGPLAPMYRPKLRSFSDQNTGEVVLCSK